MKRDLRYRTLKMASDWADSPSSAEKCTSTEESFAVVVHSPSHIQSLHVNDFAAGEKTSSPAASYFPLPHSLVPAAQRKKQALLLLRSRQLAQGALSKVHLRSESAHTLQSRRDLPCRTNESPASRGKTLLAAFSFPPVQQVATWESPRIPQRLVVGKLRRKLRRKSSHQPALWASKASVAKK